MKTCQITDAKIWLPFKNQSPGILTLIFRKYDTKLYQKGTFLYIFFFLPKYSKVMHFSPLIYIFYFQERNRIILSFAVWSFILSQFFHKLDWDNSVLFFTLELLKNSGRKKKQTQAWLLDEKTKHNLKNNKSLKTSSQFTSYYIFYGCITMETTYCCGAARIFYLTSLHSSLTYFSFSFCSLLFIRYCGKPLEQGK